MAVERAIILAAGQGTKIWPYGHTQPKAALPIGAKPLLTHTLHELWTCGIRSITIVTGHLENDLKQLARQYTADEVWSSLHWVNQRPLDGTVGALAAGLRGEMPADPILVIYGDLLIYGADIERLINKHQESAADATVMVLPLQGERPNDWICAAVEGTGVKYFLGHPRDSVSHRLAGAFMLSGSVLGDLENIGLYSSPMQVGGMPQPERDLHTMLQIALRQNRLVNAVEAEQPCVDIDKPWHLFEANQAHVKVLTGRLTQDSIPDSSHVDSSARIAGRLRMGAHSRIEGNVVIKGNLICGDHTVIHNGAVFQGNAIVGDNCLVGNYCLVESNAVIGNGCVVDHTAEFDGILMDSVYLYHYMEIAGIIGRSTDIGAGSVCGTLRFDDDRTTHRVKGRPERPRVGANFTYIGDFCRLGVNVILLPGVKIGPYSLVGPGVVLQEDLEDRSRVWVKQDLHKSGWGPERYGW